MHNHVWRGVSSTCKSTLSGCWEPLPPVTRKPQGGPPVNSTTLPPVNSRPPVSSTTLPPVNSRPPDILMLDCLLLSFFNVGSHHRPEMGHDVVDILVSPTRKVNMVNPNPSHYFLRWILEQLNADKESSTKLCGKVTRGSKSFWAQFCTREKIETFSSSLPRIPGHDRRCREYWKGSKEYINIFILKENLNRSSAVAPGWGEVMFGVAFLRLWRNWGRSWNTSPLKSFE